MTILKLAPIEFRNDKHGVSVLFQIEWKRPSGHQARMFVAINGGNDIDEALDYLDRKLGRPKYEYQPSLFHTWDWESELENRLLNRNLRSDRD